MSDMMRKKAIKQMKDIDVLAFAFLNSRIRLSRPKSCVRKFDLSQRKAIATYMGLFCEQLNRDTIADKCPACGSLTRSDRYFVMNSGESGEFCTPENSHICSNGWHQGELRGRDEAD